MLAKLETPEAEPQSPGAAPHEAPSSGYRVVANAIARREA